MKFTLFVAFTILLFTGCKKDHMLDCFKGSGKTITISRPAAPLTNIDLDDNVDLVIMPNSAPYIKVTAGENLVDGIITEIKGQTLYIRNENKCNWVRSFDNRYVVEVGVDKPEKINYHGSGNISCLDTIRTAEFTLDCFGGSGSLNFLFNCNRTNLYNHIGRTDVNASGFVNHSDVFLNDVGVMNLGSLIAKNSYVRHSSTGRCTVNVTDELGFEIRYNGNLYYYGNPLLSTQIYAGSGKLIRL